MGAQKENLYLMMRSDGPMLLVGDGWMEVETSLLWGFMIMTDVVVFL